MFFDSDRRTTQIFLPKPSYKMPIYCIYKRTILATSLDLRPYTRVSQTRRTRKIRLLFRMNHCKCVHTRTFTSFSSRPVLTPKTTPKYPQIWQEWCHFYLTTAIFCFSGEASRVKMMMDTHSDTIKNSFCIQIMKTLIQPDILNDLHGIEGFGSQR